MSARPSVVVTRRLPEAVEREVARDFDARLNRDDTPLGPEGLKEALRSADALLCTVTDKLTPSQVGTATNWLTATAGAEFSFVLRNRSGGRRASSRVANMHALDGAVEGERGAVVVVHRHR